MNGPGTYILLIRLDRDDYIRVGQLGLLSFRAGYYLYVGSALNGLRQRLARHLRSAKRLRWHVDYLLQHAQIVEIWYHPSQKRHECAWARTIACLPAIQPFAVPFGASDCSCPTHLFYASERLTLEQIQTLIDLPLDTLTRPR